MNVYANMGRRQPMGNNLLLIVNPAAGMGRGKTLKDEIAHMYQRYGWNVDICETAGAGDAARFAQEESDGHNLLMCVGGDGTLSETLGGLTKLPDAPPLCYVPMGSTNDLALSAGLPHDPMSAAAVGLAGNPTPMDAGDFNGRVFSYVASFGAFTRTSYETDRALKNKLGHLAYILTGAQELTRIQSYEVTVDLPEETIEGEFFFGAFCSTRSLGGMVKLPMEEDGLHDGKHELLMVRRPRSITDLSGILPSMLAGSYDHPLVVYRHVEKAVFHMPEPMPWSLDGERGDAGTEVRVRNLPSAYRLMLPGSKER